MAVGSGLAVGVGATGAAVAVGSGLGVGEGWESHPANATDISVIQTTATADFRLALIYLRLSVFVLVPLTRLCQIVA